MPGTPLFMQPATGDTAPTYSAQDYRRLVQAVAATEKVLTAGAFLVRQRAAGANFTVEVDPGQAIVQGDDVTNQGSYLCTSTAVESFTIPAAPASGTRTHRLVLQIRDKLHGAYTANPYTWQIELLTDTGAGLPALPASALPLATVSVAAGQASVTTANIADTRPYDPGPGMFGYVYNGSTVTSSTVVAAGSTDGTSWPVLATATVTVPTGSISRRLLVQGSTQISATVVGNVECAPFFDTTILGTVGDPRIPNPTANTSYNYTASGIVPVASLTPGTHTISLRAKNNAAGSLTSAVAWILATWI